MFTKQRLIRIGIGFVLGAIVGYFLWPWLLSEEIMTLEELSFLIGLLDFLLIGIVLTLVLLRRADKDAAETLRLNTLTLRALEEGGIVELNYNTDGSIAGMVIKAKASIGGKVTTSGTLTVRKLDDSDE